MPPLEPDPSFKYWLDDLLSASPRSGMRMKLRLPRFRLRTILIAMVAIGLILAPCRVLVYDEYPGFFFQFRGIDHSLVYRHVAFEPRSEFMYVDRAGQVHSISALFSSESCPCCGKNWEWDGARYVP